MTKYFMTGTRLEGYEKMMMLPPKHKQSGSGIFAKHRYTAEDLDCKYCLVAKQMRKRACTSPSECEFFKERLNLGLWTHGQLAECLAVSIAEVKLINRAHRLIPPKTATPFWDDSHFRRMERMTAALTEERSSYYAAVFLLSGDPDLWGRSEHAIHGATIEFEKVDVRGIREGGYVLLQAAKDLTYGGDRVTVDDLCDPDVIDDGLFKLVFSAFVIKKYGVAGLWRYCN